MTTIQTPQTTVKWWQSLRLSLIVILVVVSIIPLIVIEVSLSERFRIRTVEQVTAQLQSVSTLKTAEIDAWFDNAHSTLDIIAESPFTNVPIRDALSADNIDIDQIDALSKALAKTVEESNVIDSIFIYNFDGNVILASDENDIGKIVSRQPYFDNSIELDEFYVESPYYDIGSAELTIVGTEPIHNEAGETVGIIAGRLNVDTLSEIMLERSGLGESGETYLVSQENNYLLTPSRFEGYSSNQAYTSFGIEQALNQVEGFGLYGDYRNPPVPIIGVYSWIPQLEAAMLVEIDEAEALATFDQAIQSSIRGTIFIAVVIAAIGIFIGQRISKPIVQLAQTAQAIAGGDYQQRADVRGNNEIAVLGNSFNQMTETLGHNIEVLDATIHATEEANKELAIQSALAREATRLKSEFLATMSHELRTPLNAITGFTGILLFDADEMEEDNVHMLHRIEANAERLLALIDDVLDLSKIEAGRVEMVSEPIEISSLVQDWVNETSVLAENKHLPLVVEVDPNFPDMILGDSSRLTQIAKNLLSNAIKFTDDGQVKLLVTTNDKQWQIAVQDTGVGIPPHALNYIFDEFRQVDGSTKRAYGGTGLGLAITRNLIRMMDGTITVESEIGKGSTFTVTLPLLVAEASPVLTAN